VCTSQIHRIGRAVPILYCDPDSDCRSPEGQRLRAGWFFAKEKMMAQKALDQRVSEIEGGQQFLSSQIKDVHTDLLRFQGEMRAFQRASHELQGEMLSFKIGTESRLDVLKTKIDDLDHKVEALPRVLAELLDERAKRKR
jgi:chaperonin cofactor prefoldin